MRSGLDAAGDGSHASERVWPHAVGLADGLGCQLHLLTVVGDAAGRADAQQALRSLISEASHDAVTAEVVVDDDPATAIVEAAQARSQPLVAMVTRAAAPLGELVFGSVAAQVLRTGGYPLLLVGPGCEPPRGPPRRLLVCLDGSEVSEAILPVAQRLASLTGLEVRLFHVIYPPVDPVTRAAELSREDERMYSGLAELAETWADAGLDVDWQVAAGTIPAETIVRQAAQMPGCVIAMATHGRHALARMLVGSVTNAVVRDAAVPVLTLRPSALLH
jgi:nucleotide-binding universal stress UspA family protein